MNRQILTIVVFCMFYFTASAQKLPAIQQTSIWAPANIKIDGKATEWNNQYQAYNHATDIFYTLSNDGDNLYLTVHAADANIIRKIINGGLTFMVQPSGKKTDKGAVSITYPFFDVRSVPALTLKRKNDEAPPTELTTHIGDSTMLDNNKKMTKASRWISVSDIAGLDSLISVYNEDGIKAVGLFDRDKCYTYELAVSMKYLELNAIGVAKFAYHIILKGGANVFGAGAKFTLTGGRNPDGTPVGAEQLATMQQRVDVALNGVMLPTDFWGEYTLAKK